MMQLNSGDTAPKSANYKVVSPNGDVIGNVYMREGETLPPTQISGATTKWSKQRIKEGRVLLNNRTRPFFFSCFSFLA